MATETPPRPRNFNPERKFSLKENNLPSQGSPRTPQRTVSSTFSSPGSIFRSEEDHVILEFGTRFLRAGVAGESQPRCILEFGPEESRRVGDYSRWLPGYKKPRLKKTTDDWGRDYELWSMDLREVDIGLVGDKIERALRNAYSTYLLLDSKSRRVCLVLPSTFPHALLTAILTILFTNFEVPSVSLLSTSTAVTFAAGLRSGLVFDIGWNATVATAVYEFREVHQSSSLRATRSVAILVGKMLDSAYSGDQGAKEAQQDGEPNEAITTPFDFADDVLSRVVWCKESSTEDIESYLERLSLENGIPHLQRLDSHEPDPIMSITDSDSEDPPIRVRFSQLSKPVEQSLLTDDRPLHELDDNEQLLPELLYRSLLSVPIDVRSVCMSRIIFVGGASNIPGLKSRLLFELSEIIKRFGWDPVRGKVIDQRRAGLREINQNLASAQSEQPSIENIPKAPGTRMSDGGKQVPAASASQTLDPIEEKLKRKSGKGKDAPISGVVRGVDSLGAWAGGSLAASLRVKGVVDIEKDYFLQQGLEGVRRDQLVGAVHSRQSMGGALGKAVGGDSSARTLSIWA